MMFRSLPSPRLSLAALALVLGLSPGTPAFAEATPDDPVVADVVRMLEAGLEPRLIRDWLDTSSVPPGRMSANDMIALAGAHAPDELIEDLLQRSTRSGDAEDTPRGELSVPDAPENERPPQAAVKPDAADCCLVDFSVEYRAPEQGPAEQADAPRRDLYLYLDGRFLGRFSPRADIASRGPRAFKYRVAPGLHTIRLARELHLPSRNKKDGDARDHMTTVSPSSIEFELQNGAQWTMDIRWTQGVFSKKRPLRWRWSRNGEPVAVEENAGTFQDDWPFLCEDVEISRKSGAIAEWRANDRSRDCVTWASLWPHGVVTGRAQILAEYERTDFQPESPAFGPGD
jgi:hypothetical protein